MIYHLGKCLLDSYGLSQLHDTALFSRHNGFNAQCRCNQCLYSGKSAIFTQCFKIIQNEISMHTIHKLLNSGCYFFKCVSFLFPLCDLVGNLCLTTACRFRIYDMDLLFPIKYRELHEHLIDQLSQYTKPH